MKNGNGPPVVCEMDQYSESPCKEDDVFMKIFKYYKSNKPRPSLTKVLSAESSSDKISVTAPASLVDDSRTETLGLRKAAEWELFSFPDRPGLYLIKNPFTSLGQRFWIRKCLEEYPKKPGKSNIDIDGEYKDWWKVCYDNGICNWKLQKKMRWITLGYHHNWDTKKYSEENRDVFPEDLAELSDVMAQYLGYKSFIAEAAIVNYYHMNSTLSAHTDHSEVNLEAPLFSFSFGQSAIFLLGGRSKNIEPLSILLSSGDVVVMSKEARLCYHAVPKILPANTSPWNEELTPLDCPRPEFKYISNKKKIAESMNENIDNIEWRIFQNYIAQSRINMNVRQVLNEKQSSLTDPSYCE